MRFRYFLIFLLTFLFFQANSKDINVKRNIKWGDNQTVYKSFDKKIDVLYFKGAIYNDNSNLPVYFEKFQIENPNSVIKVEINNPLYTELSDSEINTLTNNSDIKESVVTNTSISFVKKIPFLNVQITPFIKNSISGKIQKLTSFELNIKTENSVLNKSNTSLNKKNIYAEHSVLSNGNWYKFSVYNTGIHKISFDDLAKAGIDVKSINPKNIRIYGNGGGMLPENNAIPRYDDITENSIKVIGEDDGKFDDSDYILFYATGPNVWSFDTNDNRFHHKKNLYSDYSFYFLNFDIGAGKRIQSENSVTETANKSVNTYVDYAFHERDSLNLIKTGRQWYGEVFDLVTKYDFSVYFQDLNINTPVYVKSVVIANSPSPSFFNVSLNAEHLSSIYVSALPPNQQNGDFAYIANDTSSITLTQNSSILKLIYSYDKPQTSSIAWLDYFEVNVRRNLIFRNSQLKFRNPESVGENAITDFNLTNANTTVNVWDVSDPLNPSAVETNLNSSNLNFRLNTDKMKEFVAFNGDYYSPKFLGKVSNQDLHASPQVDMVIVSYPDFLEQANRLADIHRKNDNMKVLVTTPNNIYNEFSSAAQDITSIRDMMKMFYDRAKGQLDLPKYLLFLGSGSYDYKNRISSNANLVPTYESVNSLVPTSSYLTDDYFGLLDDGEGLNSNGDLDIGIGRFPVKTIDQAKIVVDKIELYTSQKNLTPGNIDPISGKNAISNFADWKNSVCFIGDDEDGNLHLGQADKLATQIVTYNKEFNVDKIYFDAYKQISTPGGQRYPDVTSAINQRVERGALLINYTGHGGEVGLAHERVIEVSDINKWSNKFNMPVFMTATCELSRFDNPELVSAGELMFLNPNGGAVAMFTTTRLSFANSNMALNESFYDVAFTKVDGKYPKLGDLIRYAKVDNGSNQNIRNFVLLGDPALALAYPKYNIHTSTIKGHNVNAIPDTLKALEKVTITGSITDDNSNKISEFNGFIYPTIFDKPTSITTLANDPSSSPFTFTLQKNIIYKGKAKVINGDFIFTFIVPKDISYKYGTAKISYYAATDSIDANGYYDNIIIGGTSDSVITNNNGPKINLYIDNTNFISGGNTSSNPLMLAFITDENGINTTGNGIGHDITAVLDNNTEKTIVLNDYYETDLGTYKSGKINYNFSDLEEGLHNLKLKVWDVLNNSSETAITFYVQKAYKVYNFPNPFDPNGSLGADYIKTNLCFEHNYSLKDINVRKQIIIMNITGKHIKTIDKTDTDELDETTGNYRSSFIWDGKDDYNNIVQSGIYIFKMNATNTQGLNIIGMGKILVLHSKN